MSGVKKKTVQVFADGSLMITNTFFKQHNKLKIFDKDHTTFSFYKKKSKSTTDSKNFIGFKTKYLNF